MVDAYGVPVHLGLSVATDAAVEPLTLTEVKSWEKIDHSADEDDLTALIKAARKRVEGDTSLALINTTFTYSLDSIPSNGVIVLPIAPLSSVTSITAYSSDESSAVVDTSVYRVDTTSRPGRIVLKDGQSWPTGLRLRNALSIVFVAGYGAASTDITDTSLLVAMRLLIENWYANRGAVVIGAVPQDIPFGYDYCVKPYQLRGFY